MKHLQEGGANVHVVIDNPGHMTKMASMPIYVKKISGTDGQISTKLGMQQQLPEYFNLLKIMTLG